MLGNKSCKSHSKFNSTSTQYNPSKPRFRTIIKCRNDSIVATQPYQDNLALHSTTLCMSRSQILSTSSKYGQRQNKLDIREYVKKIGVKKQLDECKDKAGSIQASRIIRQNIINTEKMTQSNLKSLSQAKQLEIQGKRTIEELEQKIHKFTDQNMNLLIMQRKSIGLSKWQQLKKLFQIDKQFQNITNYFNQLKIQLNQDEIHCLKLCDLSKKIEMIETMLASQSAESDLLKLQYFGSKNQKGNTSSFTNKNLFDKAKILNKENRPLKYNRDHMTISKSIMPLSSTTSDNFKKPSKNSYLIKKQNKNKYSLNRQPLPRSCYSAQYLNYGSIPRYNYRPDTVRQSPQTSLTVKVSTYQQEYKQRLESIRKINFKELDCFKDKFKQICNLCRTTNISFMNSCKKQKVQLSEKLKNKPRDNEMNNDIVKQNKSQVVSKCTSERGLIPFMSLSSSSGFYKTQTQKQFNWKNTLAYTQGEDGMLRSEIKDRKLERLKETFKKITRK